ncbi:CoA-transferase [Phytohabitans sp. ZYX-F-186]|uniref:CoA-transferase n=1 Tax=Phytohabitans maris TaxID=3071409 RepID=A0ABU0ZBM4_9ACTN|nr:CoA-transferase [Phytohabitans sp. ZYX-F-186]MDQ7903756.1 CoA-transferase [Phytohabitans sp. ZYX-F-186]
MSGVTRAEVCVVACAEVWRGDGEILASPVGVIPTIGARLARATFAPDLLLSDGEALLVQGTWALGDKPPVIEGWLPFRTIFDLIYTGRRHVMMGPSQVDRYGNANISAVGPFERPTAQLLGVRGAPGNTVHHPTSYWVSRHRPRSFVERVDMVSGVGYDRAAAAGPSASRFHEIRRVVSDLGVFDFATPDHRMRLVSVHPGVTVEQVVAATGFDLVMAGEVARTRLPTDRELELIRTVIDPQDLRSREVPAP